MSGFCNKIREPEGGADLKLNGDCINPSSVPCFRDALKRHPYMGEDPGYARSVMELGDDAVFAFARELEASGILGEKSRRNLALIREYGETLDESGQVIDRGVYAQLLRQLCCDYPVFNWQEYLVAEDNRRIEVERIECPDQADRVESERRLYHALRSIKYSGFGRNLDYDRRREVLLRHLAPRLLSPDFESFSERIGRLEHEFSDVCVKLWCEEEDARLAADRLDGKILEIKTEEEETDPGLAKITADLEERLRRTYEKKGTGGLLGKEWN